MAVVALTDATTYVHGYDMTGDTNDVRLVTDVVELDKTNFGSGGWKEVIGGLRSAVFTSAGFWQAGATSIDVESFPDLGTVDRVHTVAPFPTEGNPAYMFKAGKMQYALGGKHGELAPFSLKSVGTNAHGVVRGKLLKAKGNVSATGALGTAVELAAVGASEYVYATFHVFSAGTTITAVLESDDNSGFTSATTRATFGPITTTGGTWATRVAGAITDTHWRLRVTAITGTFSVAGAVGIGS